jgi:hypothetical protein
VTSPSSSTASGTETGQAVPDAAEGPDRLAGVVPARRTGSVLVAFGAAGLVLLVTCLVAVLVSLMPIVNGAAQLEQQRAAAVGLIAPAADALESTAASAERAGTSLGLSASAARNGASVTSQLADALAGLAAFSSAFGDTADRSRALSKDLAKTADALAQNESDSATAAANLHVLADRVRHLGEQLGSAAAPPPSGLAGVALPLAVALVALVLAWLAAIAIASIWLGRRLRAVAPA